VVVASSGWCQDGWTALPNRHVLMVDRATLRAKVMPLGAGRPDAGPLRVAALASACPG